MIFAVERQGETVGTVEVKEETNAVRFWVDCAANTDEILRCYGETAGEPLLLGVLEPQNGRLRCTKNFSKQGFQSLCAEIPKKYYIGTRPAEIKKTIPRLWTGDATLDVLLEQGAIEAEETAHGLRICCPFENSMPFPLSFAAAACHIERKNNRYFAVLPLSGPFYRT